MSKQHIFARFTARNLAAASLAGFVVTGSAAAQTPVSHDIPLPADPMNGEIVFATLVGPDDGYAVAVSVHAEFTPSGTFTADDLQIVLGAPTEPNFDHWVLQGGSDFGWGMGSGPQVGDQSTTTLNGQIQASPLGFSLWSLTIEPVLGSGHSGVSGQFASSSYIRIDYLPTGQGPAVGYCFGSACPCGNDDPTAGCVNSTGAGVLLSATGLASAALDDLAFTASGMPANQVGLVFAGQVQANVPFGDGLRCVAAGSQGLVRLPVGMSDASGSMTIASVISTAQSVAPGALVPGSTWNFQAWYRDPTGACGSGHNLSNGLSLAVIP